MTRALRIVLALLAIVITPWPALAQSQPSFDDEKRDADAAMDAGRAAEALAVYERLILSRPDRIELHYNIGRARLAIGDFAGALQYFEYFSRLASADLQKKAHRLGEVIAELRAKVATLEVTEDGGTIRATVSLDGKQIGHIPLYARVNPGSAELKVEHPGYEPHVQTVELAPGQTLVVKPVFVRVRPPDPIVTRLGVVTAPVGATVLLDGEKRGVAPLDLEVIPGSHRVVVTAPKHESHAVNFSIAPGETRRIDLQLREEAPPLTARWWFWTGIGVVAAGITTAVIAASVERSASEGSLGTFRGP